MGAAFTGHLQDRVKAQGQSMAIFDGVCLSSSNGQKLPLWGSRVGHRPQPSSPGHPQPQDLHVSNFVPPLPGGWTPPPGPFLSSILGGDSVLTEHLASRDPWLSWPYDKGEG